MNGLSRSTPNWDLPLQTPLQPCGQLMAAGGGKVSFSLVAHSRLPMLQRMAPYTHVYMSSTNWPQGTLKEEGEEKSWEAGKGIWRGL